jgi:cell division septal protein FtsQ
MSVRSSIVEKHAERGIGQFIVYSIIGIFVIAVALLWRSKQTVSEIIVNGNSYISREEILGCLDSLVGDSTKLSNTKLSDIRERLRVHPYISDAIVTRSGVSDIQIDVVERMPIAMIISNEGHQWLVDADSVIMPYRIIPANADVPVVFGVVSNRIDTIQLHTLVYILRRIKHNNPMMYADISEVHHNAKRNIMLTTAVGEISIMLGNADDIEDKLERLASFYVMNGSSFNSKNIAMIDVRWSERIIARYKI